jgi:hypothetical protein
LLLWLLPNLLAVLADGLRTVRTTVRDLRSAYTGCRAAFTAARGGQSDPDKIATITARAVRAVRA